MTTQTSIEEYFMNDIDELTNMMQETSLSVRMNDVINNYITLSTRQVSQQFTRDIQKQHNDWADILDHWELTDPEHINIHTLLRDSSYSHLDISYAQVNIMRALEAILRMYDLNYYDHDQLREYMETEL